MNLNMAARRTEDEMKTCKIKWVDEKGNPTPDDNPAIGEVQREAWQEELADALNGHINYSETEWFPICEEHAKQLPAPHWKFRLIPKSQ